MAEVKGRVLGIDYQPFEAGRGHDFGSQRRGQIEPGADRGLTGGKLFFDRILHGIPNLWV
ncbi:MAG: hypothetical protein J4F35_22280 [Candidatus Latescibacteria bacterium]|nr:hypothetical protein [Candidatus Latescibacterota bacterium]